MILRPETDLEQSIRSHLQKFLMEMGKGYAFVVRQQHICTELDDYYIDLVFYNYILTLIDLKTDKISHQDVGQMDMYVRMYDEFKRGEGDNPTLGIILCSETDEDIARYSVLHGNEQLFAGLYRLFWIYIICGTVGFVIESAWCWYDFQEFTSRTSNLFFPISCVWRLTNVLISDMI